jgi:hypothetical protein
MSLFTRTRAPIRWRCKDQISFAFCSAILLACLGYVVFFSNGRWIWENNRIQASGSGDYPPLLRPGDSQGSPTNKKPTSDYRKFTIQGFSVFVDRKILNDSQQTQRLRQQLKRILTRIGQVTSTKQFATFKQTALWFSPEQLYMLEISSSPEFGGKHLSFKRSEYAGQYLITSADRLKAQKRNPDKARSIEIGNVAHFVNYDETTQTAIVLHELAHAYHHQVLGHQYAPLQSAYQEAMAQKLYTMMSLRSRQDSKVYAATDAHEYFAELSVAYLATNHQFPRDREVLEEYDPIGYALMQKVWGPPK